MLWVMRVRQTVVNRSEDGIVVLITEPGERRGLVDANRLKRNFSGWWQLEPHLWHDYVTISCEVTEDRAARYGVSTNGLSLALFVWFITCLCRTAVNLEEVVDSFACRFVIHVTTGVLMVKRLSYAYRHSEMWKGLLADV